MAIAFALARLAAIAAATLDFFEGFGVVGGRGDSASWFGQALSSCFRAVASRVSIITTPRSCQIFVKTQNKTRADSRTAGVGSDRAFLSNFSKVSSIFEVSMAFFER